MAGENRSPTVFTPSSMSELLELRRSKPQATLWAGGTGLMSRYYPYPYPLSRDIISLKHVPEMTRINRTERYLDIGAAATLERVLTVGHHILPPVLAKALRSVGPPTITNQATIGGNLCIPDLRLNLAAVLSLFNVQLELKGDLKHRLQTRWIPLIRLYRRDGKLMLQGTEVLTRVRIYFEEGNFQLFQQIGFPYQHPEEAVLFTVFANHGQDSVVDYRAAATFPSVGVFRDRDVESSVTSKALPLNHQEIRQTSRLLRRTLQEYSTRVSPIQLARTVRAFERSLILLNTKSVSR